MEPNKLSKILRLQTLKTKVSDMLGILDTYTPDNLEDSTNRNLVRDSLYEWRTSIIDRLEEEIEE